MNEGKDYLKKIRLMGDVQVLLDNFLNDLGELIKEGGKVQFTESIKPSEEGKKYRGISSLYDRIGK
jgi:hypothetical protein